MFVNARSTVPSLARCSFALVLYVFESTRLTQIATAHTLACSQTLQEQLSRTLLEALRNLRVVFTAMLKRMFLLLCTLVLLGQAAWVLSPVGLSPVGLLRAIEPHDALGSGGGTLRYFIIFPEKLKHISI